MSNSNRQQEPSKESLTFDSDSEVEQALSVLHARDIATTLRALLNDEDFARVKAVLIRKEDEQFATDRQAELNQPLSTEEIKDFIALMRAEAQDMAEANPEPKDGMDGNWGTATMELRDHQEAKANIGALNMVSHYMEEGKSLDEIMSKADQTMEERRSGETGLNMVKESFFEKKNGLTPGSGRGGSMYLADQRAYAYADMLKNDPASVRRKLEQARRAVQAEDSSVEKETDLVA